MLRFDPGETPVRQIHHLLLGGVAPRPIALVSTVSVDGINNLSPFSFFNAFGANPPIVAFSPSRRGRDATTKDTYNNLIETKECVVQAVTHAMVRQVSLASTEFAPDVDEFIKCGLTPIPSEIVRAPRVKESPFQMECRVRQVIPLGEAGASGNLVICEVVRFHVSKSVLRDDVIDPDAIDLVGRNSADYYTRASGEALFEIPKPSGKTAVGFEQLPGVLKQSQLLSANNLAQLASCEEIPSVKEVMDFITSVTPIRANDADFKLLSLEKDFDGMLAAALAIAETDTGRAKKRLEQTIKMALDSNETLFAWKSAIFLSTLK